MVLRVVILGARVSAVSYCPCRHTRSVLYVPFCLFVASKFDFIIFGRRSFPVTVIEKSFLIRFFI